MSTESTLDCWRPAQIKVPFVLWERFFKQHFFVPLWSSGRFQYFKCASLMQGIAFGKFLPSEIFSRLYKSGPPWFFFDGRMMDGMIQNLYSESLGRFPSYFFQIDQTRFQAQYHVGLDSCGQWGQGMEKKTLPNPMYNFIVLRGFLMVNVSCVIHLVVQGQRWFPGSRSNFWWVKCHNPIPLYKQSFIH